MPFQKTLKTPQYYSRYQTKLRRRREGKTDYRRRTVLVKQDKNKYNSPKYRLVVRRTNADIIAQIVHAKVAGDVCLAAAYSHELPRYGVKVGLTNYAAAYCTGLLVARRLLTKLNLADAYVGQTEIDGEDYYIEANDDGAQPFNAALDIGLTRASTGARCFAVLKGAVDGGIEIPHSETRFVGYDSESKELDADTFRAHLLGGHVAEYMRTLKDDDEERYKRQFARYIKAGVSADDLEGMYTAAHAAIRKDPTPAPKKASKAPKKGEKRVSHHVAKRTNAQRADRVRQIKAAIKREEGN